MYGINKFIINQVRNDYSEHLSEFDYKVDCSMGSNPYGSWPGLELKKEVLLQIAQYPHSDNDLKEAIAAYFADAAELTAANVTLACGSIGAMLALNRMTLHENKPVICCAPTFTAVVDDFVTYGVNYQPVYLKKENNYRFSLEDFLAKLEQFHTAYVYIDNPNNPTGQIIPLSSIEAIVQAARQRNSFVVIDEAYGDYMDNADSAIKIIGKYDNLAVVRTFSKGFGAAGIRLGYIVAQEKIINLVNKVNIPFSKSTIAEYIALQLLKSNWVRLTRKRVVAAKRTLLAGLKEIKVGYTSLGVPISLLYCDDENIDLCEVLEHAGLRAITCAGYDGLGKNSVRLNVHENMALVMECLHEAESFLREK